MEYDYQKIAINSIIVAIIALVIGFIFAFLNVGKYSFLFAMVIAGAVGGYLVKDVSYGLIIGAMAGIIVLILSSLFALFILPSNVAALFPFHFDLSLAILGAIVTGVVALIFDVVINKE